MVTGGAGFIGSNFILEMYGHYINEGDRIINLDCLTYAADLRNLSSIRDESEYWFHFCDIRNLAAVNQAIQYYSPDRIIHFAAESHVDNSITGPKVFIDTNIVGTWNLLEATRIWRDRLPEDFLFVHVSTDEVYGSLKEDEPRFHEELPLKPNSPYSASKASSDMLVRSYVQTYDFPAIITRCSNNYGPHQMSEKFIPLMITNALQDKELPVYGTGKNIRDWIHVRDHARAIQAVMTKGRIGQIYNIGGSWELANIEIVEEILDILDKPTSLIKYVEDRPGHDWRYAMDTTKICAETDWEPIVGFERGLYITVQWYKAMRELCE